MTGNSRALIWHFLQVLLTYLLTWRVVPKFLPGSWETCESLQEQDKGSNKIPRITLLPWSKGLIFNLPHTAIASRGDVEPWGHPTGLHKACNLVKMLSQPTSRLRLQNQKSVLFAFLQHCNHCVKNKPIWSGSSTILVITLLSSTFPHPFKGYWIVPPSGTHHFGKHCTRTFLNCSSPFCRPGAQGSLQQD